MKNRRGLYLLIISFILLMVTACTAAGPREMGASAAQRDEQTSTDDHNGGDNHAQDDHSDGVEHMHVDPPQESVALENPFADNHKALEAGEETFNTLCATCHGLEGKGDGPGAAGLDPKPADLSDGAMLSSLSDGYLFWRVSVGGAVEPFDSAMPSWEDGLTEEQRWQVIAYIRTLSEQQGHMEEMDDGHADDHAEDEHIEDDHVGDDHGEDDHGVTLKK